MRTPGNELPPMKEDEWQAQIIEISQRLGWMVAHFRPARTKDGWATPVSADGKGFPDLIMLKGERMIVIECKSEKGKVSPEQTVWLEAFAKVTRNVHTLRPSEWDELLEIL